MARRFSAFVIVADLTEAMRYRRRLMQSEAAGIPTPSPIIRRDADDIFDVKYMQRHLYMELLTDIAPNGCPINCIVVPDNRINKSIKATDSSPGHV